MSTKTADSVLRCFKAFLVDCMGIVFTPETVAAMKLQEPHPGAEALQKAEKDLHSAAAAVEAASAACLGG